MGSSQDWVAASTAFHVTTPQHYHCRTNCQAPPDRPHLRLRQLDSATVLPNHIEQTGACRTHDCLIKAQARTSCCDSWTGPLPRGCPAPPAPAARPRQTSAARPGSRVPVRGWNEEAAGRRRHGEVGRQQGALKGALKLGTALCRSTSATAFTQLWPATAFTQLWNACLIHQVSHADHHVFPMPVATLGQQVLQQGTAQRSAAQRSRLSMAWSTAPWQCGARCKDSVCGDLRHNGSTSRAAMCAVQGLCTGQGE